MNFGNNKKYEGTTGLDFLLLFYDAKILLYFIIRKFFIKKRRIYK